MTINSSKIETVTTEAERDANQQQVIAIDKGYHLVLAPAGCGKTDILAARVDRALRNGILPQDMLCLTFTNRAARGMAARIEASAGVSTEGIFIGNTHRFCSRFLFENNIVSQSSAILDEDDVFAVLCNLSEAFAGINEEKGVAGLDFMLRNRLTAIVQLQHLMMQYRSGHPKGVIVNKESDFADNDRQIRFFSPRQFAVLCEEAGMEVSVKSLLHIYDNALTYAKSDKIRFSKGLVADLAIARKYELYKARERVLDFDDLLILTYDHVRKNDVRKYSWIQIDEVQDLNLLQLSIIEAFTARDHVTVYLGDEQQAIFSFIGAKHATVSRLKERCGANVHHLTRCYRSPKYLLDIFNDYAVSELDTDPDILPVANNFDKAEYGDMLLCYSDDETAAAHDVAKILTAAFPEGRTGIIVNSNRYADMLSDVLAEQGINHFKISGTDLFSLKQTKTLFSHLNVVSDDENLSAWARILTALKLFPKYFEARQFVSTLREKCVNPSDFLMYKRSAYVLEILKCYETLPVVVFDTETTGLDVFEDDIVQIAAKKYYRGVEAGSLNIMLHTDREIPAKLGDIENPLVKAYAQANHLQRANGLKQFLDFAEGCVLIGHNVRFDYNILHSNCLRDFPTARLEQHFPRIFDTLKLSRLVFPRLMSYKLKDLISLFGLEGVNSHLADDDIVATYSLLKHCLKTVKDRKEEIEMTLLETSAIAELFRQSYADVYLKAVERLYRKEESRMSAVVEELQRVYGYLCENKFIRPFAKYGYLKRFLEHELMDGHGKNSLYEELSRHIVDFNTYREADICDTSVVKERVFVATVHKAKGLEYDNVIVFGVNDGIYPFFANRDNSEAQREDARKLYVALSRAKKRLCLSVLRNRTFTDRYGNVRRYPMDMSPFVSSLMTRHDFVTINHITESL